MMNRSSLLLSILFFSLVLHAEDKSPWSHESEVTIVKVGGNTTSDSYSGKQKTSYEFDLNTLIASARYLQTKASGTETAKQWDASLRYERELSEHWTVFVQHGAESDPYSGYTQRDNTDLGGKYYFIKGKTETLLSEAGVRSTKTISSVSNDVSHANSGRLYAEYSKQINDSVSGRLWAEYLPSFKKSDEYLVNYEPSMSVMMNQVFSLKLAYLVKYHNTTVSAGEKKEDTTFTTALVAKF
jgi:putative salt-induced outer membrane protein